MKPDAILVGDLHLRDDKPSCRVGDFISTQIRKLKWLRDIWHNQGCPMVIQSGDVFHRWKSSPEVISMALEFCPPMITIPGNPGKHNYSGEFGKDSLYTISQSNMGWEILTNEIHLSRNGHLVYPCLWGDEPLRTRKEKGGERNILLIHRSLVWGNSNFEGDDAGRFLKRWGKCYDLILSGHNHQQFTIMHKDSVLLNPGSFTRQSVAETHYPAVYLWHADDNSLQEVSLPLEEGAMVRNTTKGKEDDEAIKAFIELLDTSGEIELSIRFKERVMGFVSKNKSKISKGTLERLLESIGGGSANKWQI